MDVLALFSIQSAEIASANQDEYISDATHCTLFSHILGVSPIADQNTTPTEEHVIDVQQKCVEKAEITFPKT